MKKNLLSTLTLGLVASSLVGSFISRDVKAAETNITEYTEADRDFDTGYLLREDFGIYPQGMEGWDYKNMTRGVNLALGDIKSTNTQVPVYIKKNFVAQKKEIIADINVTLSVDITKGYISLLGHKNGKEVKGLTISVDNNDLSYVNGDGEKIYLATLDFDNTLGIRIIANAEENKASIEINGAPISGATNQTLVDEVSDLSGFQMGFDKSGTGGFKMKSLSIRKGYALYEDFDTVGFVSRVDPNYDLCQLSGTNANCTVNDHTIQNDNNALGYLAFDQNDQTYWEHNTQYAITKNVYFMVNFPQTVAVDTIRLKLNCAYKGYIEVSICNPAGAWSGINDVYRYYKWEANAQNNYTLNVSTDAPQNLTILAIGFTVGGDGYDIPGGKIEIGSLEAYCKHPKEVSINTYPQAFSKTENKNTTVEIASINGDRALQLTNNNGQKNCSVEKDINISGNVTAEFTSQFVDDKDGNTIGLINQNGDFIGIETNDGKYNVVESVGGVKKYTPIVNAENSLDSIVPNLWNRFIINYNDEKSTVNLDFNGWNPIEDIKVYDAFKNSTWTKFNAATSTKKTSFILDSIKVYNTIKESNVPDVVPCDTGDTVVTMQVCSLWREGTHTGWGIIDNDTLRQRQTVLGFYDEGTAAVSDWEVKIAREHGVSNFMFCWYRQYSGAIKTSKYSDAIWDGLFKSKFRNDINFSIMLENASASSINGYDDLITNIMPYFIEVFFKNPNYQKTKDGKPILYVYIGDLLNSIGDANGDSRKDNNDVVFALNKMRQMCVDAGLPGLHISTELRQASSSLVNKLESFGYDSIFSYTWSSGYYNVNDDYTLANAKNSIETQMNSLNNMKLIPSISKQWDPRAWQNSAFNPEGSTYTYDLEHYRQFALYVKNLIKDYTIDDAGTKMVMLDNWNEYSEGHWLMPSYDSPAYKGGHYAYGYLDVLREVFGIYEFAHTDYFPREDGYGVFDAWYPRAWDESLADLTKEENLVIDNSVADTEYTDWEIGYNTMGGETVYIEEYSKNIVNNNANRLILSSSVVKSAKESQKDLLIKGKYGEVTISKSELSKLDSNKRLEVVINKLNDVSAQTIELRKQNNDFEQCAVFDISLKQAGELVSCLATVKVNEEVSYSSKYSYNGAQLRTLTSNDFTGKLCLVLAK